MITGWVCDRLEVPVASLMFLVAWISVARKMQPVGDVLGLVGEVLADEDVVEAELVGEDHRLAVFLQRLRRRALRRMHRHREEAKSHSFMINRGQSH